VPWDAVTSTAFAGAKESCFGYSEHLLSVQGWYRYLLDHAQRSCFGLPVPVGCLHSSFVLWRMPLPEGNARQPDFEEAGYRCHRVQQTAEDSFSKPTFVAFSPLSGNDQSNH
jgi:hypothetical protein